MLRPVGEKKELKSIRQTLAWSSVCPGAPDD